MMSAPQESSQEKQRLAKKWDHIENLFPNPKPSNIRKAKWFMLECSL